MSRWNLLLVALFVIGLWWLQPTPANAATGCCVFSGNGVCTENTDQTLCPAPNQFFSGQACSAVPGCFIGPAAPSSSSSSSSSSTGVVTLPNPISCNTATCLIGQVVRYVLGIIAILATLMFIWGGVTMLTSGGNAQRVKQAKETLTWAALGVIVILLSWAIIATVLRAIVS